MPSQSTSSCGVGGGGACGERKRACALRLVPRRLAARAAAPAGARPPRPPPQLQPAPAPPLPQHPHPHPAPPHQVAGLAVGVLDGDGHAPHPQPPRARVLRGGHGEALGLLLAGEAAEQRVEQERLALARAAWGWEGGGRGGGVWRAGGEAAVGGKRDRRAPPATSVLKDWLAARCGRPLHSVASTAVRHPREPPRRPPAPGPAAAAPLADPPQIASVHSGPGTFCSSAAASGLTSQVRAPSLKPIRSSGLPCGTLTGGGVPPPPLRPLNHCGRSGVARDVRGGRGFRDPQRRTVHTRAPGRQLRTVASHRRVRVSNPRRGALSRRGRRAARRARRRRAHSSAARCGAARRRPPPAARRGPRARP
jgi:hypothetical protein